MPGWRRLRPASSRLVLQHKGGQSRTKALAGVSCQVRRAGAAAATPGAHRLRGPAREAKRPPLSAPPPRDGSAGSGRHRAAGAGHCAPGGAARP